jgi:hypothetical protein
VVWGSQLVLKLMDRYPIVITAGGALLGWIGGGMIVTDPALPADLLAGVPYAKTLAAIAGAVLVVAIGKWLALRAAPRTAVELTADGFLERFIMTQKWLVPIDGSETSLHSIDWIIASTPPNGASRRWFNADQRAGDPAQRYRALHQRRYDPRVSPRSRHGGACRRPRPASRRRGCTAELHVLVPARRRRPSRTSPTVTAAARSCSARTAAAASPAPCSVRWQ